MMYGWDMGGAGWLWGIGGLIVLVTLVVLIVWAVSSVSRLGRVGRGLDERRTEPLDILRERYARGEITREQFEEDKRTLGL